MISTRREESAMESNAKKSDKGPRTYQRPVVMRAVPAFESSNGWDIISGGVTDELTHVTFDDGSSHDGGPTPPPTPSTTALLEHQKPPAPDICLSFDRQGDVEAEHVAAVFTTSNGDISLRPLVDCGTLDPLSYIHSVSAVTIHRPLRYPYNAKGLPSTQAMLIPVLRTDCYICVAGHTLGHCSRRQHTLHMNAAVVVMDAVMTCDTLADAIDAATEQSNGIPAALVTVRRFTSFVDTDTAIVQHKIRLQKSPSDAETRTFDVEFVVDCLTNSDDWNISSTSLTNRPADPDGNPAEHDMVIKAVTRAGVGPHTVVESLVTVGCLTNDDAVSITVPPTPRLRGGVDHEPSDSTGSQHAALSRRVWMSAGCRVVKARLPADGTTCLSVFVIARHRRRHSESAASDAEGISMPWGWAESSGDHDPTMLEQAHQDVAKQLWQVGDASIAPSIHTRAADVDAMYRFTAALRHSMYTVLCNAVGLRDGVPLTRSALTADGLNGLCDLSHVALHGEMLARLAPSLARNYLCSLIAMLPMARSNAQNQNLPGALFPVQTVDGSDCAPYFVNSAPRIHVSCDVALFAHNYIHLCSSGGTLASLGDDAALQVGIVRLIVETAMAVMEFGEFDAAAEEFRLDGVTGPDEYNPLVDDNFYTLVVARAHFRALSDLAEDDGIRENKLLLAIANELDVFNLGKQAYKYAEAIVLRREDRLKTYLCHPSFDHLPEFPRKPAPNGFPLSLHVHPLVIYRHKIVQVPDTLLAMLRFRNEFTPQDIAVALAYYKPWCTHDVNWALGVEAAADFASLSDLAPSTEMLEALLTCSLDANSAETAEGLQVAPMSASWMALTYGLLGFHEHLTGEVHIDPALPLGWRSMSIALHHCGTWLRITVQPQEVTIQHLMGQPLRLRYGKAHTPVFVSERHAVRKVPRPVAAEVRPLFDGVVVLLDAVVKDFHVLNFTAWRAVLEDFFELVRNHSCSDELLRSTGRLSSQVSSPRVSFEDLIGAHGGADVCPPLTLQEYAETFLGSQGEGGQLQYSGLEAVLRKRGINLPLGTANDAVVSSTRFGLANAKLEALKELLGDDDNNSLHFNPGVESLLRSLHNAGLRVALMTFSRSADDLLARLPHVDQWISTTVSGIEARKLRVKGRPHPDLFTAAAERMHIPPSRCIVVGSELDRGYLMGAFDSFAAAINICWTSSQLEQGCSSRTEADLGTCNTGPLDGINLATASGNTHRGLRTIRLNCTPSTVDELERLAFD